MLHHLRDLGFGKSSYEPIMVEEIAELMELITKEEGQPLEMRVNCLALCRLLILISIIIDIHCLIFRCRNMILIY